MANLTTVDLTAGVPTAGTGTVMTLNSIAALLPAALAANGGLKVEGVASGVAVPVSIATAPALVAGTAVIGKVSVDQTTPGTTDSVSVSTAQGAGAAIGATTGAKVITDANGTMQQYLRGLVSQWVASTLTFASQGYNAAATFTPAASSHVANDCNGAAGTFSSMGPSGGRIMITSASVEIDGATAEATAWRLYLYNVTPPSATADDGAWDLVSGDRTAFLGYVDLGTAVDLGSTQWVENNQINKQIKLAGTDLFGYLVNLTTLTPANVAHIVTLHAVGL